MQRSPMRLLIGVYLTHTTTGSMHGAAGALITPAPQLVLDESVDESGQTVRRVLLVRRRHDRFGLGECRNIALPFPVVAK